MSDNETNFEIQASANGIRRFNTVALTGPDVTTFSLGALDPDTDYFFRVRAVNDVGNSGFSNVSGATTLATTATGQPPAAPTAPSAVGGSTGAIVVSWTDNATDEGGYEIERSTSAQGPFSITGAVNANETTFIDTALAPGAVYYYRVRAAGANGGPSSGYSPIVSASASESGVGSPSGPSSNPLLPRFNVSILRARPTQPLPGARGKVNVRVDNGGQYPGTAFVTLFASADDVIDASDIPLLDQPRSVFVRGANSKTLKLNFTYPITLPNNVRLLTRAVNAADVGAVGGTDPLQVGSAASVTLSATEVVSAKPGVQRGGRGTAFVTILNTGNEAYRGLSTITLFASGDATAGGTNDVIIGAAAKKLSLRAGQAKRIKVRYDIGDTVAAGNYTLVAKVDGSSTANGIIPAGTTLAGGTLLVTA